LNSVARPRVFTTGNARARAGARARASSTCEETLEEGSGMIRFETSLLVRLGAALLCLSLGVAARADQHVVASDVVPANELFRSVPGRPPPPLEVRCAVGFDARGRPCAPDAWNPVTTFIRNNTPEEVRGELTLTAQDSNGQPGVSAVRVPVRLPVLKTVVVRSAMFFGQSDGRVEAVVAGNKEHKALDVQPILGSRVGARTLVVAGPSLDISWSAWKYTHVARPAGHELLTRKAIGPATAVWSALAGPARTIVPAEHWNVCVSPPPLLPDRWIAYGTARAVILAEPEMADRLDPAQWEALVGYVEAGGHLVVEVTTADAAAACAGGRLASVVPARLGAATTVDLLGLLRASFGDGYRPFRAPHGQPSVHETPTAGRNAQYRLVHSVNPPPGTRVWAENKQILAVTGARGLGAVTLLQLSLGDRGLASGAGDVAGIDLSRIADRILEHHAGPTRDLCRGEAAAQLATQIDYGFKAQELLQIPSHHALLLFLVSYCLLLAPINRLVFWRLGRPLGAWAVLPLIVAGFIGVAWTQLGVSWPREPLLREVSLVQAASGQKTGLARSYLSLYSPGQDVYEVDLPGRDAALGYLAAQDVRGLQREALEYTDAARVDGLASNPLAQQAPSVDPDRYRLSALHVLPRASTNLESVRRIELDGGIEVQVDDGPGGAVHVSVMNRTPHDLEGAVVAVPRLQQLTYHVLGPIPAGSRAEAGSSGLSSASAALKPLRDMAATWRRDRKVLFDVTQAVQSHLERDRVALAGWFRAPVSGVTARPRSGRGGSAQLASLAIVLVDASPNPLGAPAGTGQEDGR
jgi:hypothetical protein